MVVFSALVNFELFKHLSAKAVLGQHTFYCFVNGKVALFRHHLLVGNFLQPADITGVISVKFIFQLLTRQNRFVGVDDDYEITGIYVGSVGRFVFTAEYGCNTACNAATPSSRTT